MGKTFLVFLKEPMDGIPCLKFNFNISDVVTYVHIDGMYAECVHMCIE